MFVTQQPQPAILLHASVALHLLKCSVSILKTSVLQKPIRSRLPSVLNRKISFEELESRLSARHFKRAFRLSRDQFDSLHLKVATFLQKDKTMGKRSKRPVLSSKMRLGMTLRMLAGASYLDIMIGFQVGASTSYAIFHETCSVLMNVLKLPGIPKTMEDLQRVARGFKHSRKKISPLDGCVGAIDGIAVRIKKPICRYAAAYYCRKGYYSLPVQAVVDSSYLFLDISIRCVGSIHDSLAHAVSKRGRFLEENGLPTEFWIAGDEAYICNGSIITPIPLAQLKFWSEDAFNYYLSSLRVHVEQAFGMLVARWRILNYLQFDVAVNSRTVVVCAKLHKFCVDSCEEQKKDITFDEVCERNEDAETWYATGKSQQWDDDVTGSGSSDENSVCPKRQALVDTMKAKGLRRPVVLGAPNHNFGSGNERG